MQESHGRNGFGMRLDGGVAGLFDPEACGELRLREPAALTERLQVL